MRCNKLRNTETLQHRSEHRAQDNSVPFKELPLNRRPNARNTPSLVLTLSLALQLGCASVTIHPTEQASTHREPDFEQSVPFSWFGLSGTHHFNVHTLCQGRGAIKIKTLHTLQDLMKGLKTVFFRLPKTAQIWCAEQIIQDDIQVPLADRTLSKPAQPMLSISASATLAGSK